MSRDFAERRSCACKPAVRALGLSWSVAVCAGTRVGMFTCGERQEGGEAQIIQGGWLVVKPVLNQIRPYDYAVYAVGGLDGFV